MATTHTLPPGARQSIWQVLDARARALLVEEFLRANPQLRRVGSIDYTADAEPIFREANSTFWYSLLGEPVQPAGQGVPTVEITQGQLRGSVDAGTGLPWFAILGALILGGVAAQL